MIAIFISLLAASAAFSQGGIHDVDFNNFSYFPSCTGEEGKEERVTVKDSEFSSEKKEDDYVDRFYFKVFQIKYGDLTGDKVDEAVVLTTCNTGGTGQFTEGFIYSIKAGKTVLLARIPGGDRADGGLREAKVEGGMLSIDFNDSENNGGACCPEGTITQKLKLQGAKLIEVGVPVKRDLFPRQEVTFARGSSGTSVKLDLPVEAGKRLVLGARAGQTLTVTLDTDKADARLIDNDADPQTNEKGFTVKLTKTGEQVIQITNYSDGPLTVIVTISIIT